MILKKMKNTNQKEIRLTITFVMKEVVDVSERLSLAKKIQKLVLLTTPVSSKSRLLLSSPV